MTDRDLGLCQDCHRAPATVRVTSRLVLCADCAEQASAAATLARLPVIDDPAVSAAMDVLFAEDDDNPAPPDAGSGG